MNLPSKSPVRFDLLPDGQCAMSGLPGVTVVRNELPEIQICVRDWLAELGLPKDWNALDAMARPSGLSERRFRALIGDESPTRFRGAFRYRPSEWKVQAGGQRLTLAHLGYIVGLFEHVWYGHPEEAPHAEGTFLMGQARLYDSRLADAAWEGIRRGIFGGVCAVVVRPADAEPGTGELVEVALAELDQVGQPAARIVETREGS